MPEISSGESRVKAVFELLGGPAVLLPIPSGQKKPADPGWQQFGDEEMSSPDYISRFNNGSNIGVVLGLPSGGLCSIDIDEDDLVEEFLKHNPTLRLTLRTRRLFGCNFWVWVVGPYPALKPFHHSRLKNEKNKPAQVGEWRSTGGQTVIEGQAEGRAYERVVDAHPVKIAFADIVWPEWISDPPMLDEPSADAGSAGSMGASGKLDESKLENVIKHGNGSIHAACPACRDDGEDKAGNHLFIKPEGKFGCCKYPADKEHRKRIWKLAGTPKLLTRSSNGSQSEYLCGTDFDERGNPVSVVELPPIVGAATFLAEDIPPLPVLVDGLLHQGTKMVIGGGSKAFKTWLLMDLAVSISNGLPWLGFNCSRGKSLYVNFEIHKKFFQERLQVVSKARGVELDDEWLQVWNLRGFAASYDSIVPMIIERIKADGLAANILDPIYKLYGDTDENSAGDVAKLMNALETMCVKTGAMTAFGAHYSKGNQAGKESIDRISGSGVFARDPDTIINFTKHEEEGCFVVDCTLRNLPPVEPFVVRWQYPLMQRDGDLDPDRLKQIAKPGPTKKHDPIAVLSFISDRRKENPVSISEWSEISGIKRQTLQEYVSELRQMGLVASVGEGSSARKYVTEKGVSSLGS